MSSSLFCGCATILSALLCSCMSQGYISGVNPRDAETAASSVKPRYYVSSLTVRSDSGCDNSSSTPCFIFRGYGPGVILPRHEFQEECRRQFMLRARERHPEIFAAEGEEAIAVCVDLKAERGENTISGMLPFFLSATILPGKEHDNYSFSITVYPGPKQGDLKPMEPKSFGAEHLTYMALLPWGLIYWGDASKLTVRPQRYAGLEGENITERQRNRLHSCVDAFVLALSENQAELAKLTPSVVVPPLVRGYATPAKPYEGGTQTSGPGGGIVAPPPPARNPNGVSGVDGL